MVEVAEQVSAHWQIAISCSFAVDVKTVRAGNLPHSHALLPQESSESDARRRRIIQPITVYHSAVSGAYGYTAFQSIKNLVRILHEKQKLMHASG
jgi:hypothetical protein